MTHTLSPSDRSIAAGIAQAFPLERAVLNRIDATRAAWMWIGKAFQDGNPHCEDCSFCAVEMEYGGSGNDRGLCVESACRIGRFGEKPSECPAYAEFVQEQSAGQPLRAYRITFKRGQTVTRTLECMAVDSCTAVMQHEGLAEEGEKMDVKACGEAVDAFMERSVVRGSIKPSCSFARMGYSCACAICAPASGTEGLKP